MAKATAKSGPKAEKEDAMLTDANIDKVGMRFYLAGASAESEMVRDYAARVVAVGHSLTMRWWEPVLDRRAAGLTDATLTLDERLAYSRADIRAVRGADVFWLLVPERPSTGAWCELGIALSAGALVVVSGAWERCVFTADADHRFETHEEALAWLVSLSEPAGDSDAFAELLMADAAAETGHVARRPS
jgi:hypothetical protein